MIGNLLSFFKNACTVSPFALQIASRLFINPYNTGFINRFDS
ncbi:hypothetical protein NBRC111894_2377 [Sporolactobacillus inulinus]|uniref:Uncharacterized protein n=1 Tax=Sporolactobacillus inulinus TaxID=2078 RepID=A0A4Y1ZCY4_9BACL|nr:hypothetical protein NBRC111894_2377 [Sporolactobacillus inulinus]